MSIENFSTVEQCEKASTHLMDMIKTIIKDECVEEKIEELKLIDAAADDIFQDMVSKMKLSHRFAVAIKSFVSFSIHDPEAKEITQKLIDLHRKLIKRLAQDAKKFKDTLEKVEPFHISAEHALATEKCECGNHEEDEEEAGIINKFKNFFN